MAGRARINIPVLDGSSGAVRLPPGATVNVFLPGTTTPVPVFPTDTGGSSSTAAIAVDAYGAALGYIDDAARVDLRIQAPGLVTRTIPNVDVEPAAGDVVRLDKAQTMTAKTLTTPTINTPAVSAGTFSNPTVTTGAFSNPAISSPAVTAGTFSNPAVTTGTFDTPAVTNGTTHKTIHSNGLLFPVEKYGAKADACVYGTADTVAGTNVVTFTNTDITITAADIGKFIATMDSGSSNGTQTGTITAVGTTNKKAVVSYTAVSTANAQLCVYGTNSTQAFADAYNAARAVGGTIECKGGIHTDRALYLVGNLDLTGRTAGSSVVGGLSIEGRLPVTVGGAYPSGAQPIERGTILYPLPGITGNWIDFSDNTYSQIRRLQIGRSDIANWAPNIDVALLGLAGLRENSGLHMEDVYISGKYNIGSHYVTGWNIADYVRCYFYNGDATHDKSAGLVLSAGNRSSLTSAFTTTNTINTRVETSRITLDHCQFHTDGLGAAYIRSTSVGILVDGIQNLTIRNCDFTSTYYGIWFEDRYGAGQTPANKWYTHNVQIDRCHFDVIGSPTLGEYSVLNNGTGGDRMLACLVFNSNNPFNNFRIQNNIFKPKSAVIVNGGSAGAANTFDAWTVENNWVLASEGGSDVSPTHLINWTAAATTGAVQFTRSRLDAMGLAMVLAGGHDLYTTIDRASSVTLASGVQRMPFSSVFGWSKFTGSSGAGINSYHVSSVTRNGVGDYTIAWSYSQTSADYAVAITCFGFGLVGAVVNQTASAVQVRCFDTAGAAQDPTSVYVSGLGG